MYAQIVPGESWAVVGVQFDKNLDQFLAEVGHFAKASKLKLKLIYAWEPWSAYSPVIPDLMTGYSTMLYRMEHAGFLEKLNALKDKLKGIEVDTKVLSGRAPEVLMAEATAQEAAMIIVGADAEPDAFGIRHFSTASSLTNQSTTPVLVIPSGSKISASEPKVLVADDLNEHSLPGLYFASQLAMGASQYQLIHFYAHDEDESALEQTGKAMLEAMTAGTLPFDADIKELGLKEVVKKRVGEKMDHRLGTVKGLLTASGGQYTRRVEFGDASQALITAFKELKPTILVMGRHKTFHFKPFGFGRVPLENLLEQRIPVVVAS